MCVYVCVRERERERSCIYMCMLFYMLEDSHANEKNILLLHVEQHAHVYA